MWERSLSLYKKSWARDGLRENVSYLNQNQSVMGMHLQLVPIGASASAQARS